MIKKYLQDYPSAAAGFDEFINYYDLTRLIVPDHICFKCGSNSEFEELKRHLREEVSWLGREDPIISGRKIATGSWKSAHAHVRLKTLCGSIGCLELQDQKSDQSQKSGFDHIEFIPKDLTVDELMSLFHSKGLSVVEEKRSHHTSWLVTNSINSWGDVKFKITRGSLAEKVKAEVSGF